MVHGDSRGKPKGEAAPASGSKMDRHDPVGMGSGGTHHTTHTHMHTHTHRHNHNTTTTPTTKANTGPHCNAFWLATTVYKEKPPSTEKPLQAPPAAQPPAADRTTSRAAPPRPSPGTRIWAPPMPHGGDRPAPKCKKMPRSEPREDPQAKGSKEHAKRARPSSCASMSEPAPPGPPEPEHDVQNCVFSIKSFGKKNLTHLGWSKTVCPTKNKELRGIVGSHDAFLLDAGGDWHLFKDGHSSSHTGQNIEALERLVDQEFHRRKLTELLLCFASQFIHARERDPNRKIFTVAVFCSWGKHRSVAVSQALADALEELGAWAEHEPLCQVAWKEGGCGRGGPCRNCSMDAHTTRRNAVAKTAAAELKEALLTAAEL